VAHNTDATALADELLATLHDADAPPPDDACVIGAGGAALAAVVASQRAGARRVYVTTRKWRAGTNESDWPSVEEFRSLGAHPVAWPCGDGVDGSWRAACASASMVVQATSCGMKGGSRGEDVATLVDWKATPARCVAYDVVYNPPTTPFLEVARAARRPARGGLGMLVGQAANAFSTWLGVPAPRDAMHAAAEHAIFDVTGTPRDGGS
jgi:shikimate 5-dehydrogenase